MKNVLFALIALVSMSASAQMGMMDDMKMDAGTLSHNGLMIKASDALIALGTTGKVAAFVREHLEMGHESLNGFGPSPFASGKIGYTDLAPVKLLTAEEKKADKGFHGFAPETATLIVDGVKYTFRMVAPVVVKDNFVIQGGGFAARYDLGQDMGEDGKVKSVNIIKISKMNMR